MNFYRQRSFPQALLLRRTAGERQLRVIPQGGPTMTNLKQVAELAGVSASTVSRGLRCVELGASKGGTLRSHAARQNKCMLQGFVVLQKNFRLTIPSCKRSLGN